MPTTKFDRLVQAHGPYALTSRRGLLARLEEDVGTNGADSVRDGMVDAALITDGLNTVLTANHGTPTGCTFGVTAITDGGAGAVRLNGTTDRIQFANAAEFRSAFDYDQPWTFGWWEKANITRSGTVTQVIAACQLAAGDFSGISIQRVHTSGVTLLRIQMVPNSGTFINFQTNALDQPNSTDYFVTYSHERTGGNHTFRITATPKSGSTVAAESAIFAAGAATDVASTITNTGVLQLGCQGNGTTNAAFGAGDYERLFFQPRYLPLEVLQDMFNAGKTNAAAPSSWFPGLGTAKGYIQAGKCALSGHGDSTSKDGDTNVMANIPFRLLENLGTKISGYYLDATGNRTVYDPLVGAGPVDIDARPPNLAASVTLKRGRQLIEGRFDPGDIATDTLSFALEGAAVKPLNGTVITRPRSRWLSIEQSDMPPSVRFGLTNDNGATDFIGTNSNLDDATSDIKAFDTTSTGSASSTIKARMYASSENENNKYFAFYGCLIVDDANLTGLFYTGAAAKDGTQIAQHSDGSLYPISWIVNTFEAAALAGLGILRKVAVVRLDINSVNAGFNSATMLAAMETMRDLLEAANYVVIFEQAWECWLSSGTLASSRVPTATMLDHWTNAYQVVTQGGNGTCGAYSSFLYFESVPFYLLEINSGYAIHARDAASAYVLTRPFGAAMLGTEAEAVGGGAYQGRSRGRPLMGVR